MPAPHTSTAQTAQTSDAPVVAVVRFDTAPDHGRLAALARILCAPPEDAADAVA